MNTAKFEETEPAASNAALVAGNGAGGSQSPVPAPSRPTVYASGAQVVIAMAQGRGDFVRALEPLVIGLNLAAEHPELRADLHYAVDEAVEQFEAMQREAGG